MKRTPIDALLIAILLSGQGSLSGKRPRKAANPGSELAQAPALAQSWRNPYAGRADAVMAGRKLFLKHCAACHGEEGRGQDKAPDLHSPIIQSVSPGVLFWFLRNGNLREGMPCWSRLPDQQRWQIVTYLKTMH